MTVSNTFKKNITEFGKELYVKLTYDDQVIINTGIESTTYTKKDNLFKSSMRSLDIIMDGEVDLRDKEISTDFGISYNQSEIEYNHFGTFIPYTDSISFNYAKNETSFTCYDKLIKTHVPFDLDIIDNTTIDTLVKMICNRFSFDFKITSYVNKNAVITKENISFMRGLNPTFRDVLDYIAQITASLIIIDDNELKLIYPTQTDHTFDGSNLKTLTVSDRLGPFNRVSFTKLETKAITDEDETTEGEEEVTYYREDTDSIEANGKSEITFNNNPLLTDDMLSGIFEQIKGFIYYSYDISSFGFCYFNPLEIVKIEYAGNEYSSIITNDIITIHNGLNETLYAEKDTTNADDYTSTSSSEKSVNFSSNTYNEIYSEKFKGINAEFQNVNVDILNVYKELNAANARIEDLDVTKLEAKVAEIEKAQIKLADVEELISSKGYITNLQADNLITSKGYITDLEADKLIASKGYITSLQADELIVSKGYLTEAQVNTIVVNKGYITEANVNTLLAEKATVSDLNALKGRVGTLEANSVTTDYLKANYADIKLSNVETQYVGNLFARVGILEDMTIVNGNVTGMLNGVRINADVITAGTLSVERLLITGKDSIVYEINVESSGLSASELSKEVYQKYLNGTDIVANSITANQIASNTITANEIASKTITVDELNVNSLSAISADLGSITAGSINIGNGKFVVTSAGALTATSATITGVINANSGKIGPWTLTATQLYNGSTTGTTAGYITLSTEDFTRSIGGTSRSGLRFAIGANFGVNNTGVLYANGGIFSGTVTATAGTIGGFSVSSTALYSENTSADPTSAGGTTRYRVEINKWSSSTTNAIRVYQASWASGASAKTTSNPFYVRYDGYMYANKGQISGWTFDGSQLYRVSSVTAGTATTQHGFYITGTTATSTAVLKAGTRSYDGSAYGSWSWKTYIRNDGYFYSVSGQIGGMTLDSSAIYSGTNSMTSTTAGIYVGTAGIRGYTDATHYFNLAKGTLTAYGANIATGTIGGWTLTSTQLYNGTITANTAGNIGMSTADFTRTVAGSSRTNLRFAIGSKFGVANDGTIYATGATISGAITATSGSFTGTVTATSGKLGGWTLTASQLYAYTGVTAGTSTTQYGLEMNVGTAQTTQVIRAGSRTYDGSSYGSWSWKAYLRNDGYLYASSGQISGWLFSGSDFYRVSSMTSGTAGTQYGFYLTGTTSTSATQVLKVGSRTYDGSSYGSWDWKTYLRNDGYFFTKSANIAGFTINASAIYKNTSSLTSTTAGIYLGTNGIRGYTDSTHHFTLTNGTLIATGGTFTGTIKATELYIENVRFGFSEYSYSLRYYDESNANSGATAQMTGNFLTIDPSYNRGIYIARNSYFSQIFSKNIDSDDIYLQHAGIHNCCVYENLKVGMIPDKGCIINTKGEIHLPNGSNLYAKNSSGDNCILAGISTGNNLFIGSDGTVSNHSGNTNIYASASGSVIMLRSHGATQVNTANVLSKSNTGTAFVVRNATSGGYVSQNESVLFFTGYDSTGVMVGSYGAYNRTYTSAANMYVTNYGVFGRYASSSIRYKYDVNYFTNKEYRNTDREYNQYSSKILANNKMSKEEFLDDMRSVLKFPIVEFKYNPGYICNDDEYAHKLENDKYIAGFIVDDLAKINPRVVQFDSLGRPEMWNDKAILPRMLFVVQEHEKAIQELRNLNLDPRLKQIENQLNSLQGKYSEVVLENKQLKQKVQYLTNQINQTRIVA